MADSKYIETVGRRKTSSARIRMTPSPKQHVVVNGKPADEYFNTKSLTATALSALKHLETTFSITAIVKGGGIMGQAEAVRHGIARALIEHDIGTRGSLKKAGLLKRDPRAKERRKPGLKKARKAPQWSKR